MKSTVKTTAAVIALALFVAAPSAFTNEREEEETINSSNVPQAVQQAAQAEAKGATIVRWEKEGRNFEAVIEKNGKQTGIEFDPNGKVLSRHDESKEHKQKGGKGQKS